MSLFIGDPQIFSIELAYNEELNPWMGRMRIWLGGNYIGTLDDTSIYSLVLFQLEKIFVKNLDLINSNIVDIHQLYNLIKSEEIDGAGKYFLLLGDSFDDFSIIAFCKNDEIIFLWMLLDKPFFKYKNYPVGLQCSIIPVAFFSKVLSEFRQRTSH